MNNSINILLLEDNLYDVELVKHQVIKSGIKFKWLHVSDWDGFVEAINSFKPDIILSDYNLGGFTGLDALEFAKKNCPLIPFIIVTGTLNEETAADTIKKGAWDYVVKERLLRLNTAIKNALVLKVEKERLQQSYNFNSFLLKTIPFGMDIVDESGTVLFQSDNFKELCGEMGIGKKCWELYKDDKAQCSGCPLHKGINIGETDVYESHNLLGGRVFEISHTGMMFKGKKALLKIFQDITKRKENEKELLIAKNQAEESDKLKTAFLHNISHEVRTPLNAIVGFSGLLNDHLMTPEKRKEFTDIIIQSSDQLLSIIDDIFSIAAIEAGQEKIVENEVNINLIAKLLKKQLSVKNPNKNVTLSFTTIFRDEESIVITDATKLTQILTNLVGNALKFTKQGNVNFGYTVKDMQLEFYVADSGIGISSDMQDAIFNRFRQVETTATREYGGSGLGLSISKAYAEMLGGSMWLTSELGKGSVFYFTIPYKKVNQKKLLDIPSIKDINFEFKNRTLLIAEDEDSNFMLLEALLSNTGISMIRAVNGLEAVEFCKSNPHIELVLMDIKMPEMDGYQATMKIKEFKPDLPIIAQTAYSTETNKNKALACGCSDFIVKPLKRETLVTKINEQLLKSKLTKTKI